MSNNINTKNVIFRFRKYDTLPYSRSKMIDYSSAGNKYANSTTLNNTYAQCVDNDMFILKKLRLANDSSRLAGPVIATDDAQVKALPDGAKFFGSQFSSTIMQKRVKSMSETVKQANGMDGI